jgi:hypothetical protein
MPMIRSLYPKNWDSIALDIKTAANWTCQECGKQCLQPGESWTDFLIRLNPSVKEAIELSVHPTRHRLTTAHLNHIPPDCSPENLKALCAPCHCRMDLKAMRLKKQLKRERHGQLNLLTPPAGQGKDPTRVQPFIDGVI